MTLPSPSRLTLLAIGLALGTGLSLVACLSCTEIGCVGGLRWTGQALDDAPLDAGEWTLDIVVEDSRYEARCTVGATLEDSSCETPSRVDGDQEFIVDLALLPAGEPEDWDPSAPAGAIELRLADHSGSDPQSAYSEVRGPTDVSIAVRLDGEEVTSVRYESLEYDRDHELWGDPECGFCDSLVERSHTW